MQDVLREVAAKNELDQLTKVILELGEVSGVMPSYLLDCWVWACKKDPLFEVCELVVETILAFTHCGNCGLDYATVKHGKLCPHCKSSNTWLICGNEVRIKEVEGA